MKLIVDVSKSDYEVIINHCDDYVKSLYNEPEERCILAVKNGISLPKGHGRLIDADDFKKKVCTYQQTGCGDCKHSLCCPEDAPTIIEADKERSDKG